MRKSLLIVCVLAATVSSSEARHWRWYGHVPPQSLETYGFATGDDRPRRDRLRSNITPADMIPPGWQLQAPDPNWKGKRFVSPDGSSWLAVYSFPTADEAIGSHMRSIAFAEGETLTYLHGQQDWIVASGLKADRFFYRKAVIACGGKVWHHIAFEYPMALKRKMDPFVSRAAFIIELAENDGCEETTSSAR